MSEAEIRQLEHALAAWDRSATLVERLGGGYRNVTWSVCLDGRVYAARLSRRSVEALQWEADLLRHLAAAGICDPELLVSTSGACVVDGVMLFSWLDGEPPATTADWQRVASTLRQVHAVTASWPQRPGFCSTQDLLARETGGDVRLAAMPAPVVEQCRAALQRLAHEPVSVIHGDPNATKIRLIGGRVGLPDWDEARVDVSLLDFADLPIAGSELVDHERREIAERAADAWEVANAWRLEPAYARQRLLRLRQGLIGGSGR